eukprot:4051532-Amphidinium_carterae.2
MESRTHVLDTVRRNGRALGHVAADYRSDREIVLTAVQQNGHALQYADESCKHDREIVLTAVKQNGYVLQYAEHTCKNDRDIVLAAVQQDGIALRWASAACRKDRELVLAAIQENFEALEYAADDLLEDDSFATEAKRQHVMLRITLLSGRCTVLALPWPGIETTEQVIAMCCERMEGVGREGMAVQLWHGVDGVQAQTRVCDWPGIQPPGVITEYQLLIGTQ